MITISNPRNFNFGEKKLKQNALRTESGGFYCTLEIPKVLSIHVFSKILNPAFLYLNAIGKILRKFDSKIFKNNRGA